VARNDLIGTSRATHHHSLHNKLDNWVKNRRSLPADIRVVTGYFLAASADDWSDLPLVKHCVDESTTVPDIFGTWVVREACWLREQ